MPFGSPIRAFGRCSPLAGGKRISTEALIDRFWPDEAPETARAAMQTHIAAVRRLTSKDLVVTEGHGYRLNVDGNDVDVLEFSRHASDATRLAANRNWELALNTIEGALELWRGDPFAELADDEFARPEITRLTELYLGLLEQRAEALIGRVERTKPFQHWRR